MKNVLTLLGCSGSMALMLATAGVATADTTANMASTSDSAGVVDITFAAPLQAAQTQRQ